MKDEVQRCEQVILHWPLACHKLWVTTFVQAVGWGTK